MAYKTSYVLTEDHGLGKAWDDINKIITITNCEVKPEDDAVTLYFGKLVGASGAYITHLKIAYNPYKDKDLYDVTGCKVCTKTGGFTPVIQENDVFASELLKTCEKICQLKFTLS